MGFHILSRVAVFSAAVCFAAVASDARAQNTIQVGLSSTIANSGAYTAGSIDTAYVTAIFGNNAYIQDATGGVYAYQGAKAGNALNGLTVGAQVTGFTGGGFEYYSNYGQFEYTTTGSTVASTATSTTTGTYASIPASYYAMLTLVTFNSAAAQGSATSGGYQNQLVTINNVSFGLSAGSTFAAGAYTITDSTGSGTFYVSSANPLVGTTVPSGPVDVSGVFVPYKGTSELQPTGTYDITAVPEPSTDILLGAGGVMAALFAVRHARRSRAAGFPGAVNGPRGCP